MIVPPSQMPVQTCGYIQSEPSLVLTVYYKNAPLHITLDGGATSNYIKLEVCQKLGLQILPNFQTSTLGDKKTQLKSLGEVDAIFSRDSWTVRLRAIVVKDLAADIFWRHCFPA